MNQHKYLFIDRDGTLIVEPDDKQVDSLAKLNFIPGVIPALQSLKNAGFKLIMVSNQDGLGTESLPEADFNAPQEMMLRLFKSQGIEFDAIHICPHLPTSACDCRKPKVGLLLDYLKTQTIDLTHSYVIGDRDTDLQLAANMGIKGLQIGTGVAMSWADICSAILTAPRSASLARTTAETKIRVTVNLDTPMAYDINTGIGFLDHMLAQLVSHAGINVQLQAEGDLQVDDHHSVEDCALVLGEAIRTALGDKRGIGRYGFLLPMDEALAQIAIDLSGRPYCQFEADFKREKVGELATELVCHFVQSFAQSLQASIHVNVSGDNAHHMIEAVFKGLGRCLRQALKRVDATLPSTKGVL